MKTNLKKCLNSIYKNPNHIMYSYQVASFKVGIVIDIKRHWSKMDEIKQLQRES